MIRFLVALLLGSSIIGSANASTTCRIEDPLLVGIKAITWHTQDGTASVVDLSGKVFAGNITLTREHNDGEKVNIYVLYEQPFYGADAAEYVVFPLENGQLRVIGVTYVIRNNQRFLSTLAGNSLATCSTK